MCMGVKGCPVRSSEKERGKDRVGLSFVGFQMPGQGHVYVILKIVGSHLGFLNPRVD